MERHTPISPTPGRDERPRRSPDTPADTSEEKRLDEALKETFPTSDPVSISVPEKEREWTEEELREAERLERERSRKS